MESVIESERRVDPFLKWAGGKRRLRESILPHLPLPASDRRYFEPFLGGGAVFFSLLPKQAILSDLNPELIEAFIAVRDDVESVIARLAGLRNEHTEFYRMRAKQPRTRVGRAARFIYLNKTCFNGLFRVNLLGEFNVPFGRHGPRLNVCDENQLRSASLALADTELATSDFGPILRRARAGDVVYLDPPYTVAHSNNGFIEYNARVFSWKDQYRLARIAERLLDRDVYVAISNASHPSIRKLYTANRRFRVVNIHRASTMAGASSRRIRTSEYLLVPRL
jgi:DNA adenine methylase